MKIPYEWLNDYVDVNIDAKELADKLTLSGSNVEEVLISGDTIQNVVTGLITKIEKHPDADKLSICQVNIGKEDIQIVTAATNMKEQDIVPVALHGSTLFDGTKIKKGKLRGVVSMGMFCSEEELGIAGDEPVHGLLIMPKDTPVGEDIKKVLGLSKAVIDFEITSNRPDCLCMVGMARETAATLNLKYKMPNMKFNAKNSADINNEIKVNINDALCKRYMARGVKNVKIAPSPAWMQERLNEAGVRPINNIVDITNFVMLELGQPMHAYDRREITSGIINVERASKDEKFTTLDEVERTLDDSVLCIKDDKRTIGLAGIMGGLNSEIEDDTTEVVFESANFEGVNIRVNSKKLGLRSEASQRFEKEIDPNLCALAIDRACALVEELGCGEVMQGTIDIYNDVKEVKTLEVSAKYINDFLGTDITPEMMKDYLDRLDLSTTVDGDKLIITVPTFRIDINIKQDIAEEIARIYGYANVPATIIKTNTQRQPRSRKLLLDEKIVDVMTACGLNQSISYSFVSPKVFDLVNLPEDSSFRNVVKIKNPLGEDYSVMRTTTVPSMMECLARNYSRSNEYASLFEIGKIYIPNEDETKLPLEKEILTIGMYGDGVDYLDIKGIMDDLIDEMGLKRFTYKRQSENPMYHPGKTAEVYSGKTKIAVLGEVHPDVSENYGVGTECYIAQVDLEALYENVHEKKEYKALPKFPAVTRDIALLVDDDILVQEIEDTIKKTGGNLVESTKLFDIYKGKQIPEGKKSIAYAIVYRDNMKTLTDKEINKVHDKILRALEFKLGAQLR